MVRDALQWVRPCRSATCWRMSTSDSDYSIDYLASDSEDSDSAVGLSPDRHAADSTRTQPSSSLPPPSSSSLPSVDSLGSSDCSNDEDLRPNLGSASEHRSRPIGDSGDSGRSRDGNCEDTDNGDPQLSGDRGSSDGNSMCGGSPPEPAGQNHSVSGTSGPKGCRHDGISQRQRQKQARAFWDTTVSSHAWDDRGLSPGGKPSEDRKRVHCSWDEAKPEEAEKDHAFAQKCTDLQCYLRPLSSILRGLRSGRYSERLSGFQESVAMDRIQRIMWMLQNPNMGERYTTVILKMEEMLHSWFPHIRPYLDLHPEQHTDHSPLAKKPKLCHVSVVPPAPASPPGGSPPEGGHHPALRPCDAPLPGSNPYYSSTHLKLVHSTPVCSSKNETAQQEALGPGKPAVICPLRSSPSLSADRREQTQDDAVSSSTDPRGSPGDRHSPTLPHRARPRDHRQGPPSGKISSPCLERLLQSKKSIISLRNTGGDKPGGGSSWL
ncbi:uncharacterized protein LOC105029579 isoform X1 [Esox lucius]|uniref:Circadian associated repressor of transcription a n=1 Tax=Esox lucius TaxID=8010 RepID=A0AAY5KH66_ESOLU|nr:uncharacterized protein LOC105029579 isoform X1 [Esox lucius]